MAKLVDSVGGDLDRIGTLPDPILSHILSFLPSKEAIRTSVLSSRWRYMFATMSTFDFTHCLRSLAIENGNNFKNFVDRLLSFQNQASLECFKLLKFSWIDDDVSHLYGWISAVLSRGVKKLVLYTPVSPALSSRMFTSHSLVKLKLETYGGAINVPNDVCLPNLKSLHLVKFILVDDSIFRLISSCIVLEKLVLTPEEVHVSDIIIQNPSLKILGLNLFVKGGRGPNNLVEINAPNLVDFHYSDYIAERYTLSSMKSLQYADILVNSSGNKGRDPTYLVQAICNVQSLYLFVDLAPVLSRTSREPVLAFNNLVELGLINASCEWLVEFLHCVPILKTLYLGLEDWGFKELPKEIPSCLSFHLKEISVAAFNGVGHMFELIKYFLDNAMVLEKLRIGMKGESLEHQSSILEKLSKLPKKSKKCRVITV